MDILEHFEKEESYILLENIYASLKEEGGYLFCVFLMEKGFLYGGIFSMILRVNPVLLLNQTELLKTIGFNDIAIREEFLVVHRLTSLIRWIIWKTFIKLILYAETCPENIS